MCRDHGCVFDKGHTIPHSWVYTNVMLGYANVGKQTANNR